SPCLDSADGNTAPLADAEGNHRFNDLSTPDSGIGNPTHTDMGALERQDHSHPILGSKYHRMIAF
ncbi:hypothetical protein ACFL38_05335, partial [Candidatus Omnitrophota bacterium]